MSTSTVISADSHVTVDLDKIRERLGQRHPVGLQGHAARIYAL